MIEIEKMRFESDDTAERVIELLKYLDRLADDLNYAFDVLAEKTGLCENERKKKKKRRQRRGRRRSWRKRELTK